MRSNPSTPAQVSTATGLGAVVRPGLSEAAAITWRWQESSREGTVQPNRARDARRSGSVRALVGLSVAAALALSAHRVAALAVGGVAVLLLALAWIWPLTAYARIEGALNGFGRTVGRLLAWVLLVPVFLLFFWGCGRWLRRGRRDALQRWVDPAATSYWRPRAERAPGIAPYQRQF